MSVEFCCLAENQAEIEASVPTLVYYTPTLALGRASVMGIGVVLGAENEATAGALLAGGISRVFVGEAALLDIGVMARLQKRFGAARLGLHVPVQRQAVSWSFDRESNADFSVVTPSLCQPTWEVLRADATASGILADSWIAEMLGRGLSSVLLRVDMRDDADLNLCAGMVEMLGNKLWLAPLTDPAPMIADWVRYGRATQLALPSPLYHRRHELVSRTNGAATSTTAMKKVA